MVAAAAAPKRTFTISSSTTPAEEASVVAVAELFHANLTPVSPAEMSSQSAEEVVFLGQYPQCFYFLSS